MNKKESYAASICENYLPAKKRMFKNKKEVEAYREKLETAMTQFERILLEDCITHKEQEMEEDVKTTSIFETAVPLLDEEERCIIMQLYKESKNWREVVDCEGNHINSKKINKIRIAGITKLDSWINLMQHDN